MLYHAERSSSESIQNLIIKYLDLARGQKKLWNIKGKVISIVVGFLRTVSKAVKKRLGEQEIRRIS